MNKRDQKFFDEHWEDWVKHNPPPDCWIGTKEEWAYDEMPCCGFVGRIGFWVTYYFCYG